MIKKVFTVLLLAFLVTGAMISVDCSDAAVKRNRVRPRTVSKPVTQPAPTATQQTTAAPAAAATATAPKTTTRPCRYDHPAHYGPGYALWPDHGPEPWPHRSRRAAAWAAPCLVRWVPAARRPSASMIRSVRLCHHRYRCRLPKEGSPPWLLPRLLQLLRPRLWRTCWATAANYCTSSRSKC